MNTSAGPEQKPEPLGGFHQDNHPPEVAAALAALDKVKQKPDEVVDLLARQSQERWEAWQAKKPENLRSPSPLEAAVAAVPDICSEGKAAILNLLSEFHKVVKGAPLDLRLPDPQKAVPLGCFLALSQTVVIFAIRYAGNKVFVRTENSSTRLLPLHPDFPVESATRQQVSDCVVAWDLNHVREALLWRPRGELVLHRAIAAADEVGDCDEDDCDEAQSS